MFTKTRIYPSLKTALYLKTLILLVHLLLTAASKLRDRLALVIYKNETILFMITLLFQNIYGNYNVIYNSAKSNHFVMCPSGKTQSNFRKNIHVHIVVIHQIVVCALLLYIFKRIHSFNFISNI